MSYSSSRLGRSQEGLSRTLARVLIGNAIAALLLFYTLGLFAPAQAQTNYPFIYPSWVAVGEPGKAYGEASLDFRNTGNGPDWWFPGHKRNNDGPYAKNADGTYGATPATVLNDRQTFAGGGTDRHECGFYDIDGDGRIDAICVNGAQRGFGDGEAELYRNVSTATQIAFEEMNPATTGLNAGDAIYGRKRTATFFKRANGKLAVLIGTQGEPRGDGKSNANRLFEYAGNWQWVEFNDDNVTQAHYNTCMRAGDLNKDGLDDILMCRDSEWAVDADGYNVLEPAGSIVYYQRSDGTFREDSLLQFPLEARRWRTARIVDWNGDGRKDVVVSIGEAKAPRVAVYRQLVDGTLNKVANFAVKTTAIANSIGVADLNGDSKLDLYITQSVQADCIKQGTTGPMTDTVPDVVYMSSFTGTSVVYTAYRLGNEPTADGCSWLVTPSTEGKVHLARGYEGAPGQGYEVNFTGGMRALVKKAKKPWH